MPRYFVELEHSPEECLPILQALLAQGPDALIQFDFACAVEGGRHVAVAIVDAKDESEVRAAMPPEIRDRARLTAVAKYSPEEVRLLAGL